MTPAVAASALAARPIERFAATVLSPGQPRWVSDRLSALARRQSLPAGGRARITDRTDAVVFVDTGATKLVAHAAAGREQIVAFHFAGDLLHVPGHAAHEYSLCALGPSELLVFPAAAFLERLRDDADACGLVLERTLLSLQRCRDKALMLGRKTAPEKVADFLVNMAARIGHEAAGQTTIELPMPRRDIADSLGLTIETVSRQFTELRTRGLIETVGRATVHIADLEPLRLRAGHVRRDYHSGAEFALDQ